MVKALMGPWWAHGDASPTLHCLFLDLFHMRGKYTYFLCLSHSVQFRCSAMSDSLWPHGLQHIRLPCPTPLPEACSNSCSTSQWCHLTISSSVVSFSSCLKSFPASGSLPMSQLFESSVQSTGASASASVLPMNIQDWFPWGLTGWISLQSKGLSRVYSNTTVQKPSVLWCSAFFAVQLLHPYMTTGKTIALTIWTFVDKVMSLLLSHCYLGFLVT